MEVERAVTTGIVSDLTQLSTEAGRNPEPTPSAHVSDGAGAKCQKKQSQCTSSVFVFISWRLITLQYCSGFCHTLKWISHRFTCVPHPDPHSHLPLHPIPLGLPSAPGLSACLMHPTWAGSSVFNEPLCSALSRSVVSDSLRSHGLQPTRLLCPWDSLAKNTGAGYHALLQEISPTQGSNPGLLHCRWILYQASQQGSPRLLECVAYPFSRGTSQPKNQTGVFCIEGGFFICWATPEAKRSRSQCRSSIISELRGL